MAKHARRRLQRQGDGVQVTRVSGDVGLDEAHRRFGGLDVPASLAGTLCALGTAVLLAGLAAGVGSIGYQRGVRGDESSLSLAGLISGLVVLLVAFLVGGWVAGRMARYDGARNGLMTAGWFIILAAVVAGLGAWLGDRYDFFSRVNLPQWFSGNARGAVAIGTGLLALVVMLAAGMLGGILGARYHRGADELIANTRPGGVAREPRDEVGRSGRVVMKPADGNGALPVPTAADYVTDGGRS
jgi:hypothetical protein